jgi:hypothetical protein
MFKTITLVDSTSIGMFQKSKLESESVYLKRWEWRVSGRGSRSANSGAMMTFVKERFRQA